MIDDDYDYPCDEGLDDDDEWTCDACGGPMYRQAHWGYGQCDDCGARQELEDDI
jgi:predicted ATP-dependent serine protease